MRPIHPLPAMLALSLLLFSSSCRKNSSTTSTEGCITRYQPDINERVLPISQYDSAKQFFESNGLSLDTLQPLGFYYSGPDVQGKRFYQVPTRKFINGLPVFNARLLYDFFGGVLNYSESEGYEYPLQTSDTTARLSPDQVRAIFLASDPDNYANGINLVAVPHKPVHWADSCIYATLQYNERSLFDSCCSSLNDHVLVKTWSIQQRPDGGAMAWIRDETGGLVPHIIYTLN